MYRTRSGSFGQGAGNVSGLQRQLDASVGLGEATTRDYDGFLGLARTCLSKSNVNVPGDPRELLTRAMTSSDFPKLLANTATKLLQEGYKIQPATYRTWMRPYQVKSFAEVELARIAFPGILPHLPESAEYQYLDVTEDGEQAYLLTYGGLLSFSRQLLVNDDLGAFRVRAKAAGLLASRTLSRKSYMRLLAPGNLSDGSPYFGTGRGNLVEGDSGNTMALDADSLGAAIKALRTQKDAAGNYLDFAPKYLLVPPSLEITAWNLCYSASVPGQDNSGILNIYKDRFGLTPVVAPELADTDLGGNDSDWFIFADPDVAPACFNMLTLDEGWPEPYVEHQIAWESDAAEMKVRTDFSVWPVNPLGCVKIAVHTG